MKKLITLLAVIIFFTSCTGEEVKNNEEGNTEDKKITICLDYVPNTNHTGIFVAEEKGYFKDLGLDVEIIQPPDDGAPLLVASGGAQIGIDFQDLMAAPLSQEEPLPITAVAAIIQHNTSGIVSLKGNGMDRPKGMEGKTYATWDSPIEKAIIKEVVEKDGGDYDKINMVPYTITDTYAGLESGIDAVWIYYGWDGIFAEVNGIDIDYFDFASIEPDLDCYTPVFIANNDFLKKEPETAKAVLKALKQGYEFSIENPEEAADILLKKVPELDKNLVVESQKWLGKKYSEDAPYWGYIDQKRWDRFYDWLFEKGLIEKEIPNGFGFTNDFLTE